MKKYKNNILLILAGLLFVTSISADSLIHDHFHQNESSFSCEYFENKSVDAPDLAPIHIQRYFSKKVSNELRNNLVLSFFRIFNSRAPPTI